MIQHWIETYKAQKAGLQGCSVLIPSEFWSRHTVGQEMIEAEGIDRERLADVADALGAQEVEGEAAQARDRTGVGTRGKRMKP